MDLRGTIRFQGFSLQPHELTRVNHLPSEMGELLRNEARMGTGRQDLDRLRFSVPTHGSPHQEHLACSFWARP